MDITAASFETKKALSEKLQEERVRMAGQGKSIVDHDLAIRFLSTGSKPANWRNYEILSAAVEDFKTLCGDYGVTV